MFNKEKTFYIAYDVFLKKDKVIHGSGTFVCKGKPDLKKWIEDIETHNFNNGISTGAIQVLSCIEVKEDFIK
jgi:hypothetical protein